MLLHPRSRPRGASIGEEGGAAAHHHHHQNHRHPLPTSSPRGAPDLRASGGGAATASGGGAKSVGGASGQSVEDVVYEMALWLRSNGVIVALREYMTAIDPTPTGPDEGGGAARAESGVEVPDPSPPPLPSMSASNAAGTSFVLSPTWSHVDEGGGARSSPVSRNEAIYQELLEAGCLVGTVSTSALCWRFGLDHWRIQRLREWGLKERKLAVITRIPAHGDDFFWGIP